MVNIIKARKVIFLRTILVMREFMSIRVILVERIREFIEGNDNTFDSPVKQALQITYVFDPFNFFGKYG